MAFNSCFEEPQEQSSSLSTPISGILPLSSPVLPVSPFPLGAVVAQAYVSQVMDESVLAGNSAVLKCVIPSFVTDFVSVQGWQDMDGRMYYPVIDYGRECGVGS